MSAPTFAATWRHPGTWIGFAGSALLALGAATTRGLAPNYAQFRPIELLRARVPTAVGDLTMLFAIALLGLAFYLVRPSAERGEVRYRWVFVLWALPLLLAPPVLSEDVYLYLDQGWQWMAGFDPYSVGLTRAGGPYATLVNTWWRGTPAIYPPLAVVVQGLVTAVGAGRVLVSVVAMRVVVIASFLLLAACLPTLARRVGVSPQRAIFIALCNPVSIVHGVGGSHNDALMLGIVALAFVIAPVARVGLVAGAVLAGVAGTAKQPGLWAAVVVAMIAVPAGSWLKRLAAAALAVGIAGASFVAVSLGTGLGFGWVKGTSITGNVGSLAPGRFVADMIRFIANHDVWGIAQAICYLLMLGVFAWLVLKRWNHPFVAAAGGWMAYALLAPALYPWYLVSAFAFLGLLKLGPTLDKLVAMLLIYVLVGNWFTEVAKAHTVLGSSLGMNAAIVIVWGWSLLQRARLDPTGWLPARLRRRPAEPVTVE